MTELAIHADQDIANELCEQVRSAYHDRTPLRIVAGNTRAFYGRPVEGTELNVAAHSGIVSYDPIELVVTVRAGTRLSALNAALAEKHQMLPFEPPIFGDASTIGGAVATGMSGPRRPWAGAARDFVLGTRVITQEGKLLRFGGEVMKNVA
ncbi:MAG TPA: glycolate oxidase subunit GlcE, partial [Halomonas sp.]|nr:glycolate oxidase subunit GlcE [Halomonas sp.]